jgi:FkbM family methyltransferase
MSSIAGLWKPEYLLQPRRLARRILGRTRAADDRGMFVVPLPWGLSMAFRQLDDLAQSIDRLGVYDLVVTETIWRLVHPGDTVLDVGANVGFMTIAMAARLGERGRVFAFEPHPGLFGELSRNVEAARRQFPGVVVRLFHEAVSDTEGTASLHVPPGFDKNRGLSHLGAGVDASVGGEAIDVPTRRLDDRAEELGASIALMKIDVEGHEPAAFRGARSLFERGIIDHVILEEHRDPPTEATSLLTDVGYTLFSLERSFLGPRLGDAVRRHKSSWEAPSLLATRRPESAQAAFRVPGWRSLGA